MFKNSFNFTVYPVMGNHESYPVNVYDYFSDREKRLNSMLSGFWEEWIGTEAAELHKKFGYYTSYNKNHNLKIIGINTQACNDENWYLLRNPTDPGNMLDWFRQEMILAEQNSQNVYVVSHIPSRNCLDTWEKVYDAIIRRFSHVIKGHFFGHTHNDGFVVYRDEVSHNISSYALIGGSLTTYSNRNPAFRILEIDQDSMLPINYQVYLLNLTKWNAIPEADAKFEYSYDFVHEYNVTDMSNESMEKFINKLQNDTYTIKRVECHSDTNCNATELNQTAENILQEDIFEGIKKQNYSGKWCDTVSTSTERKKYCGGSESWQDWAVRLIAGKWKKKIEKK